MTYSVLIKTFNNRNIISRRKRDVDTLCWFYELEVGNSAMQRIYQRINFLFIRRVQERFETLSMCSSSFSSILHRQSIGDLDKGLHF